MVMLTLTRLLACMSCPFHLHVIKLNTGKIRFHANLRNHRAMVAISCVCVHRFGKYILAISTGPLLGLHNFLLVPMHESINIKTTS